MCLAAVAQNDGKARPMQELKKDSVTLKDGSTLIIKEVNEETAKSVAKKKPFAGLIDGVSLSAYLFGVVGQVFGNDYMSFEAAAEFDMHNRFFPIVEVGYGSSDSTDDDKDIHYKVAAPYFRVGMNYNFFHKKDTPNYIYGGVRLGFSSFSYDVDGPSLNDPVWGDEVPFQYEGLKSNASWLELVVGLRAEVWKNFHMGWSLRYKRPLSIKESPNAEPWYVPGFGINKSALFGASYNLIYYLPW